MEYRILGNTGIHVSKICFGALTIGPLQRNMSLKEGSHVLNYAIDSGINFVDTADLYETYPFIKEAIKHKPDLIVSTKSYAYDKKTARETLDRALKGIGRDYVDFFLLHEQEGPLTMKGHYEALKFFVTQKEKGVIRGVGISTHFIAAVWAPIKLSKLTICSPSFRYTT
jgi:aryl-alcohol dehydrogenase-like predicted oxidoreductase